MKEFAAALMQFVKAGTSGTTLEALRPAFGPESIAAATTLVQVAVSLPPATRPRSRIDYRLLGWFGAGLAILIVGDAIVMFGPWGKRAAPVADAAASAATTSSNEKPGVTPAPPAEQASSPKSVSEPPATVAKPDTPPAQPLESSPPPEPQQTGFKPPPGEPGPFGEPPPPPFGKGPPKDNRRRPPLDPLWDPDGPARDLSAAELFRRADHNRDDRLDPGEMPYHLILRADKNKDGQLSLEELRQALERLQKRFFEEPTAAEAARLPPRPGGEDERRPPPRP